MQNQLTLKQAQLHCLINYKSTCGAWNYYKWLSYCENLKSLNINKKELYYRMLNVYVIYHNKL